MNIIVKQSLSFVDHGAVLTGSGSVVTVANRPEPQKVPDWIRKTATWNMAVASGKAFEVQGAVPESFAAKTANIGLGDQPQVAQTQLPTPAPAPAFVEEPPEEVQISEAPKKNRRK